jgi:hypothetical protein
MRSHFDIGMTTVPKSPIGQSATGFSKPLRWCEDPAYHTFGLTPIESAKVEASISRRPSIHPYDTMNQSSFASCIPTSSSYVNHFMPSTSPGNVRISSQRLVHSRLDPPRLLAPAYVLLLTANGWLISTKIGVFHH